MEFLWTGTDVGVRETFASCPSGYVFLDDSFFFVFFLASRGEIAGVLVDVFFFSDPAFQNLMEQYSQKSPLTISIFSFPPIISFIVHQAPPRPIFKKPPS